MSDDTAPDNGGSYEVDRVTDDDRAQADPRNIEKMSRFVTSFARKTR